MPFILGVKSWIKEITLSGTDSFNVNSCINKAGSVSPMLNCSFHTWKTQHVPHLPVLFKLFSRGKFTKRNSVKYRTVAYTIELASERLPVQIYSNRIKIAAKVKISHHRW